MEEVCLLDYWNRINQNVACLDTCGDLYDVIKDAMDNGKTQVTFDTEPLKAKGDVEYILNYFLNVHRIKVGWILNHDEPNDLDCYRFTLYATWE